MISPKTPLSLSSSVCLFDNYTQTQRLLSEIALHKFRVFFQLSSYNDTVYLYWDDIVPYFPIRNALNAIKTMTTKLVKVADLALEDAIEILYEGPLYVEIKYEDKAISFKVNSALAPYWEDILRGPLLSNIGSYAE